MELIIIDSERMKVMLDPYDVQRYALHPDEPLTEGESRRILDTVLRDAAREGGFSLDGELYIEIFPSRAGGCELFLTKNRDGGGGSERAFHKSGRALFIYSFASLEMLLATCRESSLAGVGGSLLYYDEGGRLYYLCTERECYHAAEYDGISLSRAALPFIEEHCRLVCASAVRTLASFAV